MVQKYPLKGIQLEDIFPPVNVQKQYSKLKIAVTYIYGDNPDVTVVTYTYKE